MYKTRFTSMLAVVLLGCTAVFAQPNIQIEWQRTIGGDNADKVTNIFQTPDGGYILGGVSGSGISGEKTDTSRGGGDYWILKVDDTCAIEWQKTIGGGGGERSVSVAFTSDGGYILGGVSNSGISGEKTDTCRGQYDYWIVKLDASGSVQWQKTYGGADNGPGMVLFTGTDNLSKIIQTSDGGYMAGGYSNSGISGDKVDSNRSGPESFFNDYWVVKMDTLGNIEWQKTIGGNEEDRLYDLIQTNDGGYLLGGYSNEWSLSGEKTAASYGGSDYWIVKLDASGNILWDKTHGGDEDDALWSLAQVSDGGYIMAGQSFSGATGNKADTSRGNSDYWVVKTDANGVMEWNRTYGSDGYDMCKSVVVTSDSGYLLQGMSSSAAGGDKTEMGWGDADYWVIKINDTGDIDWQKALGGNWVDQPFGSGQFALETTDEKYVVGGYSYSAISGNKTDSSRGGFGDYWIVKLFEDCPDTTQVTGAVCSSEGYLLPWDSTVYAGGAYSFVFPSSVKGSRCDSMVVVTLTGLVDTSVSVMDSTLTSQDTEASYQWIDCGTGEPIAGATEVAYTAPANAGTYAVIVTANGCSDTSSCYTLSGTGIADPEFNRQFSVYPNPAKTRVNIESKLGLSLASIRIFNVLGEEVFRTASNGRSEQSLDIRQLADGMYLLHIETNKGVAIRKLDIIR